MTTETAYTIINELEKEFKAYNKYFDVSYWNNAITIDINWGDWKHEHLFAKWTVNEVLGRLGYTGKYTITEDITEEDGSDTYSAIHTIRFRD